jgi:quercetin dioxygenase-like cupin family protein
MDLQNIRRVVTGQDQRGRSAVLGDGRSPHWSRHAEYPAVAVTELWHAFPSAPTTIVDGATGRIGQRPGPGASRFYAVQIDPGVPIPMHATPTVDYHFVVEGEVTCLLDGDGEVTVCAGDVLIMQANAHGWINRGSVPFQSVAVMVNAEVAGR